MADKIESIRQIASRLKSIERPSVEPNRAYFANLMQQEAKQVATMDQPRPDIAAEEAKKAAKPTLFDEVSAAGNKTAPVNRDQLLAQLDDAVNRIDTLKDRLQTPNLEIRNSVQRQMQKKLDHVDNSLNQAIDRVGGDRNLAVNDATDADGVITPIKRFLGLLSQGQSKLMGLSKNIQDIASKKEISPASLLAVQIKVGVVQHEIEFFTSLLNKALESTKTIMNVQV